MLIQEIKELGLPNHLLQDFIENPSVETANKFINDCFNICAKRFLYNIQIDGNNKYLSRSIHSVFVFIVGKMLMPLFQSRISEKMDKQGAPNDSNLVWMLCSLYHDCFLSVEENGLDRISKYNYSNMLKACEINHTIYDLGSIPENEGRFVRQAWRKKDCVYSCGTIRNYYNYRYYHGKIDHGILSGLLFFDRLVKEYLLKKDKDGSGSDIFMDKNGTARWDNKLFWNYAFISDAIIAHNIWHLKEFDLNHFPELSPDSVREKKITLSENPLAYMLSLSDTIEPTKVFSGVKIENIIINLDIALIDNAIIITQSEDKFFDFEFWNRRMGTMSDWLDGITKVYCPETESITIRISQPDL